MPIPSLSSTASTLAPDPGLTSAGPFFEALEQRTLLYTNPFLLSLPDASGMASPDNTVVRIMTTKGNIDIELYDKAGPNGQADTAAPRTTANFLNYIDTGRLDETFFHRLIGNFVLQGGGFSQVGDTGGALSVLTDPPIQNEFSSARSNKQRTLAMAKQGGSPDSATSQFFINLSDNGGVPPSGLDFQNGGFSVFGRVLGDASWTIVTTIAGLNTLDLDDYLTGSSGLTFDNTPVDGEVSPGAPRLVKIVDIEVVKAADQPDFYDNSLFFPDGFRSRRIISTVTLLNTDPNADNFYQVVARYELSGRDEVIASGFLKPGASMLLPISEGGNPALDLVRPDTMFAYEIRSTGPLAASLNHTDFGATAGEAFFSAAPFADSGVELRDWGIAGGIKGGGTSSFLVWQNVANVAADITITFYPTGGVPFTVNQTLNAYRRGGLNVSLISDLPDGSYSARITSTQPIVAYLSQYTAATVDDTRAMASIRQGFPRGGLTEGIASAVQIPTGGSTSLNFLFAESVPSLVVIDLDFFLNDGRRLRKEAAQLLFAGALPRRASLDMASIAGIIDAATGQPATLPVDELLTIKFSVRTGLGIISGDVATTLGEDVASTPFTGYAARTMYFAGAFYDPTPGRNIAEVVSLFNPLDDASLTVRYVVNFHFDDDGDGIADEIISAPAATLGALRRVDIRPQNYDDVIRKIQEDPKFRHFGISIQASILDGTSEFPAPAGIVGQHFSVDGDNFIAITSLPVFSPVTGGIVSLDDPVFDRAGGGVSS